MKKLLKDVFISSIESIRLQTHKDSVNADYINKVFNTDTVSAYDNSSLVKAIISLLQLHFPKIDGFCEIEHYCFDMNFGKIGNQELITPEDLWYQLTKKKIEAPILFSKENQETIFKIFLESAISTVFEGNIDFYTLIQNKRYVIEIKSIEELSKVMPDYKGLDGLKELFEIDPNHKEYVGFGSSISQGWKPLFIHPEGKVIVPFEKVKNIPNSIAE